MIGSNQKKFCKIGFLFLKQELYLKLREYFELSDPERNSFDILNRISGLFKEVTLKQTYTTLYEFCEAELKEKLTTRKASELLEYQKFSRLFPELFHLKILPGLVNEQTPFLTAVAYHPV